MNKITNRTFNYLPDFCPNVMCPETKKDYRFVLGHLSENKNNLVWIGMNPSAATKEKADATVNKVQTISREMGYDGWVMLNVYPERATDVSCLREWNEKLMTENVDEIVRFLEKNGIGMVCCAWGNIESEIIKKAVPILKEKLTSKNIKLCALKVNKTGEPRHPLYLGKKYRELKELS